MKDHEMIADQEIARYAQGFMDGTLTFLDRALYQAGANVVHDETGGKTPDGQPTMQRTLFCAVIKQLSGYPKYPGGWSSRTMIPGEINDQFGMKGFVRACILEFAAIVKLELEQSEIARRNTDDAAISVRKEWAKSLANTS